MILNLVISKPSYIDYGVYSISIREEMVMDPLYPVSDSFLSVFAVSGDLPPGLHFNETTGVISGSPLQEGRGDSRIGNQQKTYHIQVVGSNRFGSVQTDFKIVVNSFSEKADHGVVACTVPVPSVFKGVAEELFTGTLIGNCVVQSSFSWVRPEGEGSVLSTRNVRLTTYFSADYAAPYSFTLKSAAEALLYLDDYSNPLLQAELSSQPVNRRVTIMLSQGLHRLVLYSTDSYVALFYGSNSIGLDDTLLTHDTLFLPIIGPLFSFFPTATGFEGIPLDIKIKGWRKPVKLSISMSQESLITTSPSSVRVVDPRVGEYEFAAVAYNEGGSRLIQQSYRIELPREGMMVTVRSELSPEVIVMQKAISSMESFTEAYRCSCELRVRDLPIDVTSPFLSYHAILQLFTTLPFVIEVDEECEVVLNDHLFKENFVYQPSTSSMFFVCNLCLEEVVSLDINCIGINNYHTMMIVFNGTAPAKPFRILSPLPSFSYQFPAYHCIRDQPCPNNDLISLPSNCTIFSVSPLPVGFELFSNGTLACSAVGTVPTSSLTIGCLETPQRLTVQVSVGGINGSLSLLIESVIKPTSLMLTVNGQEIGDSVSLPLGEVFYITVILDHSNDVTLTSIPPLPASVLLSSSSITGNVTEVLSNNYTLIARNSAGAVSKKLFIQTEPCHETFYYIRFNVGRGQGLVKLDSEVKLDHSVDPSVVVPICTTSGTLTVSYQCSSPQGCWFTLYRGNEHLPSLFVRYNEHRVSSFILPYDQLFVNPWESDFVIPVGQSISSIFWYHHGFFSSIILHDLPSWIVYDPLENCLSGYAEESGFYEGSVEVLSSDGNVEFDLAIEVLTEKEIKLMNGQPVVIEMLNEVHSTQFPWFEFDGNLTYVPVSLTNVTTHRILQSVLIPRGESRFTDLP